MHIELVVCVQGRTKLFIIDALQFVSENILKCNLSSLCCTICNEISVRYSDVMSMLIMKNDINADNISCTDSRKSFRIHYWLCQEMVESVF